MLFGKCCHTGAIKIAGECGYCTGQIVASKHTPVVAVGFGYPNSSVNTHLVNKFI